jgi:hypothetical protein
LTTNLIDDSITSVKNPAGFIFYRVGDILINQINQIKEKLGEKLTTGSREEEEEVSTSKTEADYSPIPISHMDVYTYNDILIYQRIINPKQIKEMVADWKPNSVGTPEVSFRNGVYWLIDGNHRRVAAAQLGFTHLDCKVHTDLTIDEEARMFVTMNGKRTAPSIGDLFKAKLAYHDASAVALRNTIENECGLQLKLNGKSTETGIPLTATLYKMWENGGHDEFKKTIETIKSIWLGYPKAWNSGFIIGVNHFLYVHPQVPFAEFEKKLCVTTPNGVIMRASGSLTGNMNSQTIYRILVDYYNIKRRSGRLEYRDMVRKPIVDDSQT